MKQIKNSIPFQQLVKDTNIEEILDPEISYRNKFVTICSHMSDTDGDLNDVDEHIESEKIKETQ